MTEIRGLTEKEWPEALVLLEKVFQVGPWLFHSLHQADPERNLDDVSGAWVEGELVALIDVFFREVYDAQGTPRSMGGIGSVATHPEYRGRGLSYALMERALERMALRQTEWSMLFTGIPPHYEKHGYRIVPRRWWTGPLRRPEPGTEVEQVPYWTPASVARLQAMHAATARHPLAVVRPEVSWRTAQRERLNRPGRFTLVGEGSYLVGNLGHELELQEISGDPAEYPTLVAGALRLAAAQAVTQGSCNLPSFEIRDQLFQNETAHEGNWTMARGLLLDETEVDAIFAAPNASHSPLDDF